jgi:PBSX family phage terminase large subunit
VSSAVTVRYEPRGAARELFACRDGEVLITGPAGTGKSLAALYKLHLACLQTPGVRALVVRKTAVSLTSTTLVTLNKKVLPVATETGLVQWYGGSAKEPAAYRYTNGSTIVVGGMDKPEKVLSSEYDLVFADEATELSVTDWETLGTRLRNGAISFQQQIAACNPSFPSHWLKQRADHGTTTCLRSLHSHNPAYFNLDGTQTPQGAQYMAKLRALTGVRKLRLLDGIWAAAEGVIYETFDPGLHVLDRFEIPDDWARYWVVDFGHTNPFVLQCWAQDGDGRLYLYREIYHTRRLVEDHAATILSHVTDDDGNWTEPRPKAIICDHDAEGRATLVKYLGMSTTAAKKTVSDGIEAVQARLRPQDDGRPRLFVLRDSLVERDPELVDAMKPTCTEEEFPGYIWDLSGNKAIKETPLKLDDHGMDATRYLVAFHDLRPSPRVRFM